ncbi:hypothetical protein QBC38DRAFT_88553 [Podospora fimiseda]|uniref:Uncharacterized protein n=1 Tax=Podospora fimiseda TaxID=252190 RepID=A0AAN7BFI0_9PEZI|nr:hypothetical protein QBC38DRAFT_88553 [Podospora fimiseda]
MMFRLHKTSILGKPAPSRSHNLNNPLHTPTTGWDSHGPADIIARDGGFWAKFGNGGKDSRDDIDRRLKEAVDKIKEDFEDRIAKTGDEREKSQLGRERDGKINEEHKKANNERNNRNDPENERPRPSTTAKTSAAEAPSTTSKLATTSTTTLAPPTLDSPLSLNPSAPVNPSPSATSFPELDGASPYSVSPSISPSTTLAGGESVQTSDTQKPTKQGSNGTVFKVGIAVGSVACLFIILACIVFIFRRGRGGGSQYSSNSSYISSNKSSSSRRKPRMSRDMEETLLEDEPNELEKHENPKSLISRWMSEVHCHQITDPARISVSVPSAGTRFQGQPADISDISSILTTAVTHTTHSTNGNFKPRTALRHPNLPPIGASLTQPFNPNFYEQSPTIEVSPDTPSSSSVYSQNNNVNPNILVPSIPLAARLSGVGVVVPPDPYLEDGNYMYSRDSMGSNISSMSAKSKRRSI